MKLRIPLMPVSRLLLYCAVETVALVVVSGAIVGALPYLRRSRDELQQRTLQLAAVPDSTGQQSLLETSLGTHAHDIDRISAYIPAQDAIPEIIEVLEGRAAAHQVEVRIPGIKIAEAEVAEEGEPTPTTSPYQDVEMLLQVVGQPEALLRYMHDVEHLPYLFSVIEWEIGPAAPALISELRVRALATPAGETVATPAPSAQLSASLLLKVVPNL